VHSVSDGRKIVIHTAESLVSGPSCLEVKVAIVKIKRYKSPGSDQIQAKVIQAGGETLLSEIVVEKKPAASAPGAIFAGAWALNPSASLASCTILRCAIL
jgi:hypothetical protein